MIIQVGCNYHTTWQSNKGMRFVLVRVEGEKVVLKTRTTHRQFTTNLSDLIFIETPYNIAKAKRLAKESLIKISKEFEL
jgi:hypothetical protein